MLEKLQGGSSSLFHGIAVLQRLVGFFPDALGHYYSLHIQNTQAGIEVVLVKQL